MEEIVQVKSSAQLYRLISGENLHLRRGYGRDDALLRKLSYRLELDSNKPISQQLESKKIPLEEFVQAFFSLTEPFAKMLSNIYSVMQHHQARKASRSIRMRFSFQKISEKLDFDLKHYRELQAIYRKLHGNLTIRLWSSNDIGKLFYPIKMLRDIYGEHGEWNRHYSSPLPNPHILYIDPQWRPLRKLRDSMEQLRLIASEETGEHAKAISVLMEDNEKKKQTIESDPSKVRLMLSDFWPGFVRLLSQLEKSSPTDYLTKDAIDALQDIDKTLHEIKRTRMNSEILVRELVELLRLPFWKYRWRVYEVWVMLEVIDCLDEYKVALEIVGDRLTLEEYKATKVAQFEDLKGIGYQIWTQLSTTVNTPYKRKHIMPDIRFCRGNASSPENTFLMVECKQRKEIKLKNFEDLIADYNRGASKSILNLFVNYDMFPTISSRFPSTKLLSNVNPAYPSIVNELKNLIKQALKDHRIDPAVRQFDAILFDVSESMRGRYIDSQISKACKDLLGANQHSKIFFFGSNLLSAERLSIPTLTLKLEEMIRGSTNLDGALRELHTKYPDIGSVAVVTDGGYDDPIRSDVLFEILEELILGKNFPVKTKKS